MNETEIVEFESQLLAHGWYYDPIVEQFLAGERRVDWASVQALVTGGSAEGLSAYQDLKRDEWRRQRPSRQDDAISGGNKESNN